jgi:hypothetical protein
MRYNGVGVKDKEQAYEMRENLVILKITVGSDLKFSTSVLQ